MPAPWPCRGRSGPRHAAGRGRSGSRGSAVRPACGALNSSTTPTRSPGPMAPSRSGKAWGCSPRRSSRTTRPRGIPRPPRWTWSWPDTARTGPLPDPARRAGPAHQRHRHHDRLAAQSAPSRLAATGISFDLVREGVHILFEYPGARRVVPNPALHERLRSLLPAGRALRRPEPVDLIEVADAVPGPAATRPLPQQRRAV
jgi:hypothetical protein